MKKLNISIAITLLALSSTSAMANCNEQSTFAFTTSESLASFVSSNLEVAQHDIELQTQADVVESVTNTVHLDTYELSSEAALMASTPSGSNTAE